MEDTEFKITIKLYDKDKDWFALLPLRCMVCDKFLENGDELIIVEVRARAPLRMHLDCAHQLAGAILMVLQEENKIKSLDSEPIN